MIVIVGAGISGLTLAHELEKRGVDFVLLESSGRVGGVMRSECVDGQVLEWGPQRARLTPDFAMLVDDLGLRERLIEARRGLPLYVYRGYDLAEVPTGPRGLLGFLTPTGALRALLEPFTSAARDDETVGGYFRRKLGRQAYEDLAGPLYGGLYASDPDDMIVGLSLGHTLRDLGVERSLLRAWLRRSGQPVAPACSFVDGLEELPRALHERHRGNVRLNTPVRSLERRGSGWSVVTDGGAIECAHVVIATPAAAAGAMLREALPDTAASIAGLVYNPLAIVHLRADVGLDALGFQVSLAEPLVTRGVTFQDSLFARRGVYTAFLGGAKNRWVESAPDEQLARIAVEEFMTAAFTDAEPIAVGRAWMPAWDRSWRSIQRLALPSGLHVHANWHARAGIPGRLAGSRRLAETLAKRG